MTFEGKELENNPHKSSCFNKFEDFMTNIEENMKRFSKFTEPCSNYIITV